MPGPADNSNTREDRRDLDAVFQRLVCALEYTPAKTIGKILKKLQGGQLHVQYHIAAAARSRSGKIAPPEGLTGPVLPAAWINRTMQLNLVGDRLTVWINGAILGFAWRDPCDTFFSVDWHVVEQIWPLPAAKAPASVTTAMAMVTEVKTSAPVHAGKRARLTDVETIRSLAKARGWSDDQFYRMSTGQVMKLLGDDLKELEGDDAYRERSRSNYRRAQGRLKDRLKD